MHDELIAHQGDLTARDLTRYAEVLGLDTAGFSAELRTAKYAQRVAADVATADASGVTGTPTFFINGKRHHGSYDVVSLTSAVRGVVRQVGLAVPLMNFTNPKKSAAFRTMKYHAPVATRPSTGIGRIHREAKPCAYAAS